MSSRIRDLEHFEEQDPNEHRKLGTVVMALLAIVALTFAVGAVLGHAADPGAPDALDRLDKVAAAQRAQNGAASAQGGAAKAAKPSPVAAADLSFERNLSDDEERPEVLAALAAASREEDRLAASGGPAADLALAKPESVGRKPAPAASDVASKLVGSAAASETAGDAASKLAKSDEVAPELQAPARTPVPAAVAAAASRKLEQARKHDKLIAAALPRETSGVHAAAGREGEFVLQVISYDSRPAADAFANSLRARGHEAYVTSADIEGRGRWYRVRLGPFDTKQAADAYRREFEAKERMNTIVIRRAQDAKD